jgi:hypothetical protein
MRALIALAFVLCASGASAQSLRPKPSIQEVNALFARAIAKIELRDVGDRGKDETSYLSALPVAQFEDKPNRARTETQVVDDLLTRSRDDCKTFRANDGPREVVKGIVFRRLSTDCLTDSGRVQHEVIVAVDAARNQLFRLGGDESDQQDRVRQIVIIYNALLASYR